MRVGTATGAVVGNAGLVKKVRFPLSVLPLSAVGFALVHFALQMVVLLVAMIVSGYTYFAGPQLLLAIPAIGVALLFTVALSFLVAGLNVRYRDTQHVVEVVLMAGFWLNPIVYSVSLVRAALEPHGLFWAYFLNPMAGVVDRDAARALRAEPAAAQRRHRARRRRLRLLPGEAGHRRRWCRRCCWARRCGRSGGCRPTSPRSCR